MISKRIESLCDKPIIVIFNKSDLTDKTPPISIPDKSIQVCTISALKKTGITELHSALCDTIASLVRSSHRSAFTVNRRHATCLKQGDDALQEALRAINDGLTEDFFSENLKDANRALAEIIGEISPDDVLDNIFSDFCIGK